MLDKEYIERNSLIENLNKFAPEQYTDLINQLILKQPIADVQPVVHARWIPASIETEAYCSNCHGFVMHHPLFATDKYCRFCGAKMDKE